jgi:hypothetical protein
MPLVFAAAAAHAPGITGWPQAAEVSQRDRFHAAYLALAALFREARPETVVMFAAEHWANFFLDNYPAFCIARAESFMGPLETAINIPTQTVRGDPETAGAILEACYANGIEPSFTDELTLDHGTMVPYSFLAPGSDVAMVPILINALTPPLPSPRRCFELGRIVGEAVARSSKRIAIVASGGLSHNPGTPTAGVIDQAFDREFLRAFCAGDTVRLCAYTTESIAPAGFGAQEIRNWIALAAATPGRRARLLGYEAVAGWSTGCALAILES